MIECLQRAILLEPQHDAKYMNLTSTPSILLFLVGYEIPYLVAYQVIILNMIP